MVVSSPLFWLLAFMLLAPVAGTGQNIYDTLRTVKMTALADYSTTSLDIQWKDDVDVNSYSLYKKLRPDTSWGAPLIITGDQDTSYLDSDIEEGVLYEYRIIKETGDSLGYAYLFSGVDYVPPQRRGDLLIVIDAVAADFVSDKLSTYMDILTSEGWNPWLAPMATDASVQEVKSLILQYYANTDSLTAVLLMGNIAVPHAGNINPDGHTDHKGAWPADLYYGDIDGIWTDETVDNVSSDYPRIHNIPGDGHFDQGYIPGQIELAIGRIDFSELPIFDLDEYELLDNYLQKNIEYRTGEYQVRRRAVFRNRNPWVEGLGQNAIRNFVPLVSPDSLVYVDYLDAFNDSYLWSYGGSSGSMTCSNGFGCIDLYANSNFQAVFTANFGSYFGDYDFENNYLRTILASGKVLSAAWVGAPNWYFHPMGMGLDLGTCTLLTQNNTDIYYGGVFPQSVTINLLGDPTLKAFIVQPPQDLVGTQNGNQMELNWAPSDDNILGYQVYKKVDGMDYFDPIHLTTSAETSWVDSCVSGNTQLQYLVRAVKREITPSGSFINHSSGPIISIETSPNILPEANFNLSWEEGILSGSNFSSNANQFQWILPDSASLSQENFTIPYDQEGVLSITLIASNSCFSDTLQQAILVTNTMSPLNDEDIRIYPNPSRGFTQLATSRPIVELHLYNSLGAKVLTKYGLTPGVHTIDLQDLTEGLYWVKIHLHNQVVSKMILLSR